MDLEPVRVELESEQTWRRNEIRFLKNQLTEIDGYLNKKRYRKSLVVMLYAHYEGFCKFALLTYIEEINKCGLLCREAVDSVVAGSWWKVFHALEFGDKKARVFSQRLPDEDQLHRFARRVEFVQTMSDFLNSRVELDDDTINTESNLWPIVLKKNLYKVGLEHDSLSSHDGQISRLLNMRNNIAHGNQRDGVTDRDYGEIERSIFRLMDSLMDLVLEGIRLSKFKKSASAN